MPELPEVETVRKSLEKLYLNKKIIDVDILLPRMILSDIDEFKTKVINATFISFTRIGKYLFLNLDNGYSIISHLRMEGKYIRRSLDEVITTHTRVIFYLNDNSKMCYDDSRSFGIMKLTKTENILKEKEISKLGPEPFSINDGSYLYNIYQRKNVEIKEALLDQEIMTGLGNIYADEVLFDTCINPFKKCNKLTLQECNSILESSKKILNHAIELGGSTISSYHPEKGVDGRFQNELNVYGKKDLSCPRCSSILRKGRIGGRGTTYCPKCQHVAISIGVTGKIASGKSEALRYLKSLGYPIFSSDEEVVRLYKQKETKIALINLFGEGVLNDDGTISKPFIKNVISQDQNKKIELENIIHPMVKKSIIKFINEHREEKIVICEVPLMFEKRFDLLFDYILGTTCSSINQIEHLKNRGSKTISQDLVIALSNTFDKNISKCDFLVNTDGSIENAHQQIDEILKGIA